MLRFTTRDLLWLTVVAAMACGWFLNDRSWRRYRDHGVAFTENEARRVMLANARIEAEIQALLIRDGETEKLNERRSKAAIDGERKVDRNITVPRLVP